MEDWDENGVAYRVDQYVFVDEQQQTETILFKDLDFGHMQSVVFVDHKKVLKVGWKAWGTLVYTKMVTSVKKRS